MENYHFQIVKQFYYSPCWTTKSGTNSIWFDAENAKWNIGLTSQIESRKSQIVSQVCDEDWPQNLSSGWKYLDGENWIDAGTNLNFEAKSKDKDCKIS